MSDDIEFTVTWSIEVSASSPDRAALEALAVQRDPSSTATVFEVESAEMGPITIDLDQFEDRPDRNPVALVVGSPFDGMRAYGPAIPNTNEIEEATERCRDEEWWYVPLKPLSEAR